MFLPILGVALGDARCQGQSPSEGGILENTQRDNKGVRTLPNRLPGFRVVVIREATGLIEHLPPLAIGAWWKSAS